MANGRVIIVFLILLVKIGSAFSQSGGTIHGRVIDAETGDYLPGANIMIVGTAVGAATNVDGQYRLSRVSEGEHILRISYMGYKTEEISVHIGARETKRLDVRLTSDVVEIDAVEVTALLDGQTRAINQQITSNTIVNVVSRDRIQELPDENAAEAVSRLPGISLQRNAGEGQKVVVRGLAPRFNAVTVDGVRIPSTDEQDRSVDLTMISTDVLAGIEVYKAARPDQDAETVGGSVNFQVGRAPERTRTDIRLQSGYNNHATYFPTYRGNINHGFRTLDRKLGIVVGGNYQHANRSSHLLDASYEYLGESVSGTNGARYGVQSLNLGDRIETRNRYGVNLSLDYDFVHGGLFLNSFWGRTDRDEVRRRKRYRTGLADVLYDIRDREINTQIYSNSLRGDYDFGLFKFNIQAAYSLSDQNMPIANIARFREAGAFTGDLIEDQGPELIPLAARNNLNTTYFQFSTVDSRRVIEDELLGQFDVTLPFASNVFDVPFGGYFKLGMRYRGKSRDRQADRLWTSHFGINSLAQEISANPGDYYRSFDLNEFGNEMRISSFLDPNFSVNNFLNGHYDFGPGISRSETYRFYQNFKDYHFNGIGHTAGEPLYVLDPRILLENYDAGEKVHAGYIMWELNIGRKVMFLSGLRYEQTTTDYAGKYGAIRPAREQDIGVIQDTTGAQFYEEYLPMVHARYKFADWADIRLAYTQTLARPNYYNLVPYEEILIFDNQIQRGNPNLQHTRAGNYDMYTSFYGGFGLFTIGAFYKELENIDFLRVSRLTEGPYRGYTLTQPENAEGMSTVIGFEIDLQTNFRFLPSPFDGLILTVNYTGMTSETFYPFLKTQMNPEPPYNVIFIDTVRVHNMVYQPDYVGNISVGYEKKSFTGRVSVNYQGESLITVGRRPEEDGYVSKFVRVDVSLQQRIFGDIRLFVNLNNINNFAEKSTFGARRFPELEEYFSWTADIGIRYRF